MLMVRLYADLAELPHAELRRLKLTGESGTNAPVGSRLATTLAWIERRFGRAVALRAVSETVSDILGTPRG